MTRLALPKLTLASSLLLHLSLVWPSSSPAQTQTPLAPAAQAQPSRKPAGPASASPTPESPQLKALRQALTESAGKVVDRIQAAETELYQKLSYFQKPERLDPNTFASVDEVQDWEKLLQELRDKGDRVASLYANAGKSLDAELTNSKVSAEIATRFRQMVLDGFPWDTIQKKNQLFQRYVDAHGQLLAFFEKNWGAWEPGQPLKFKTARLASAYRKIKEDVVSTGKQLDQQYKAMAE
ncbi:MAG: hypothetical protein JO069_00535 [Verrucomicrobia bacterium]|nr:hypothetical protein [Verrucomicrobiota bacterium]